MPNQPISNAPTNIGLLSADTNRTQLIIRPELAFNEAMAVAVPNVNHYQKTRFTGETLKATKKTDKSAEITPNRGVAGLIMLALNGGGGFTGEFSSDTYDAYLEAFMGGTWTNNNGLYVLQNGNLRRSFGVEKGFLDVGHFFRFAGQEIDTFSITINAEKIIIIEFGFMGSKFYGCFDASVDAAALARQTTPIVSAGLNVGGVKVDGNAYAGKLSSIKIDGKNNLRERPAIGNFYTDPHGFGDFDVTVTLTGYFAGTLLFNKFVNHLPLALEVPITGYSDNPAPANNTYTFKLPNLQIPDETINIPGRNADVMENVTLNAFFDVNGVTMEIDKASALLP